MTVIKTLCTFCGSVTLRPDEIVLIVKDDETSYIFDCPECETPMEYAANPRVVDALLAAGCDTVKPAPLPEVVREAINESIRACRRSATYDLDPASFHDLMESGDTLEAWGLV